MEWYEAIILFLGATSILGLICIVKLLGVIDDLRTDIGKLRIGLAYASIENQSK